jgi:DNA-binding response OmpR family regulator/anti-sigma regulatory factor (Ser/Thr protein kinase)
MTHSILVVEDEANLRTEIADMLSFEGYLVFTAADGEEGVLTARELHPDLIICDINMPKMDGYAVLDTLRADDSFIDTPFLFLTARTAHADIRAGMKRGADDYLTKPFTITELIEAVEARLARIQAVAAQRDQSLEEAKRTFMRMVVHELRTPVSALTVSTDMLMESLDDIPAEDLSGLARIAKSNSQRLNLLVERVIMFVRSEMGDLNTEDLSRIAQPYPLGTLLARAEEQAASILPNVAEPLLPDRHLPEPDVDVSVATPYITYALAELIANAVKFSARGERASLRQWSDDDYVYVGLTNRGTPLSAEEFQEALKPFAQIGREEREQQGIGLGLTLAERILRGLGGSLALYAEGGDTTQTVITLRKA